MDTHIIRLRWPWECEAIAPDRLRYTRRFGLPTNLGPLEKVWVVVAGADQFGTIALNNAPLGQISGEAKRAEFDVTRLLAPRNVLVLEIELPPEEPGATPPERPRRERSPAEMIGEVRLEIRS
ncbi:MAG TPA: hypothetical protein VGY55_04490 [Pirellulales bacterium]|nr:hypothetical protein [Pirellulales bacterium]